ncbi:MAG: octaprenyl diphosphate synthase [Nevskiaceae bacterium]|nr:MAG: octaprenyl diphosphate synthase [Nevskiaceae bacterium]TBR74585.1 MAG: octaprenyl diphosphate synthase [Nevskiaceae bacterium]
MTLSTILAPVADDMVRVNVLIHEHLHSEVALINRIGSYITGAGGKRLRPALLLLIARALGAEGERARLLAVVIEFIHTATLLHDDVVDDADLRRGRATASAVWGNAGAVLSGDFLYSRSFQLMVQAGDMSVMHIMADATNAIAEGEVQQLINAHDPDVDEARYLRVIELKTARLFEAAAALGAVCAGGDAAQVERMRGFGHAIGMAYQLVDDLLDYIADPQVTGKNIGADLAEGKPTLPLIYTMVNGSRADAAQIRAAIENGASDHLASVLAAVERGDAIPYTRALAARYRDEALAILQDVPAGSCRDALEEMATFIVTRVA